MTPPDPAMAARLTAIAERLKAATPGLWTVKRSALPHDGAYDYAICDSATEVIAEAFGRTSVSNYPPSQANAEFIANAPADIRLLLAHVETLTQQVAELQAASPSGVDSTSALPQIGDWPRVAPNGADSGRLSELLEMARTGRAQERDRAERAEQENARLTAALKNYGGHFVTCDWHNGSCTCGLDAALVNTNG